MNFELFNHIVMASIQYLDMVYENFFLDREKTINWPFECVDLNQVKSLKIIAASQIQRYIYLIGIHVSFIQNWDYEHSFPVVNSYLRMIANKISAIGELNDLFFFDTDIEMVCHVSIVKDIENMQNAKQITSAHLKELDEKTDRLDKIIKSFYERIFTDSENIAIENGWDMSNQFGKGIEGISDRNNPLQSLVGLFIRFKIAKNRLGTYEYIQYRSRLFYKNYRILINILVCFIQRELIGRFIPTSPH